MSRRGDGGDAPAEMPRMWDGDGAWRDEGAPPASLPPEDEHDPCARLIAASNAKPPDASRRTGVGGGGSTLAGEISRLERAFGGAFAARAVATCADASGRTALSHAARSGDVDGLDACVRVRKKEHFAGDAAPALDVGDSHDVGPLTLAAWQGHTHVVDYLLRNGASPNRRDSFGVAALHKAVGHGHLGAALRILGDGGADVNLRVGDIADSVPAHYRAVSRHQTALHIACYPTPNPKFVAALLRFGADPDVRDDLGNTALHYACGACDVAAVRLLTRAGADTTKENTDGHAPGDVVPTDPGCNEGLVFDVLRGLD
jgi:hypothetical protein